MKRAPESELSKEDVLKAEAEEKEEEEKEEKKEEEKKEEATEEKKEESLFNFTFGPGATSGTGAPFNFATTIPVATPSTSTFSFGDTNSSSIFNFAKSLVTKNGEEENEDDDPEKEVTAIDKDVKVIPTLSKEELLNGEEGEETEYTVPRMKLFELETVEVKSSEEEKKDEEKKDEEKKDETAEKKKVWKERGLGVLRLNVDPKTHMARILIRREPTHQSMANFNIIHETKVSVDAARKTVTVQTIEPKTAAEEEQLQEGEKKKKDASATSEAKISFYMIRVPSTEIASELSAKIIEHIPKTPSKSE